MLIGDKYFKEHPEKVLGVQTVRKGQFGNDVVEVKGSVDHLKRILTEPVSAKRPDFQQLAAVHSSPQVERGTVAAEKEKAYADRLQLPKHDNEDVLHDLRFGSEFWNIYNSLISRQELEAYLYAHPEFDSSKLVSEFKHNKHQLLEQGLLFYINGQYQYRYEYITGNLSSKLSQLKEGTHDHTYIVKNYGKDLLQKQREVLQKAMPYAKSFSEANDSISLLPHSSLATFFTVASIKSGIIEVSRGKGAKDFIPVQAASLNEAFRYYLRSILDPKDIKKSTKGNILKYYLENKTEIISDKLSKEERDQKERERTEIKNNAKKEGDRLFQKFILEELLPEDRKKLETYWNEKYNSFRILSEKLPEGYEGTAKIPVAFSQSRYFGKEKNGKRMPLRLSDTQRNGVARSASNSVLLGYGVGLGKTLTDILAISQLIELGVSKRPLIIVPNNVYYKWRKEIFGEVSDQGETFVGALPHFPPARDLYNLNNGLIRNLKQYTAEELSSIKEIDRALELLAEESPKIKAKEQLSERIKNPKLNAYATDAARVFDEIETKYLAVFAEIKEKINSEIQKAEEQYKRGLNENEKASFQNKEKHMLQEVGFYVKVKGKLEAVSKGELFIKEYRKFLNRELDYKVVTTGKAKPVPSGTISLVTYEGLAKIGIKNPELILDHLYNILTQGDSLEDTKEAAKIHEHMKQLVSSSYEDAKLYIDELGIDSIHIDEVHMAKNIFDHVKGEPQWEYEKDEQGNTLYASNGQPERRKVLNEDGGIKRSSTFYELKGQLSKRALLTYMLVHYLQRKSNNRGVIGLSATPFNNSPLEIYSMLSLINHQVLESAGFTGLKDFFDTFMKIETDIVIKPDNSIKKDTVLKGFCNLPQLRQIILSVIDYRTNEQAGTNKPLELVYPSQEHNLKSRMVMTPLQASLMGKIEAFMSDLNEEAIANTLLSSSEGTLRSVGLIPSDFEHFLPDYSKRSYKAIPQRMSGVAILMGLTKMKALVLSPLLYIIKEVGLELKALYPLTPKSKVEPKFTPQMVVSTSPKLQYIMGCLKSVLKYSREKQLPVSGQIIYSTIGTDLFPILTDYLIAHENGFGLAKHEVATITGSTTALKKERIKNEFNEGKIKVLFGSKAIQVGVDLQKNTSTLYMLDFDWNPTDDEQVRGRHARQGNRHNWVRTVYAMLENSVDPIIFQYLLEKAARIKEIWDIESDLQDVDLSDIDFEQLKDELITDPRKRAEIEILREEEKYNDEEIALKNQMDQVRDAPHLQQQVEELGKRFYEIAEEWLLQESKNGKLILQDEAKDRLEYRQGSIDNWENQILEINEKLKKEQDSDKRKKLEERLVKVNENVEKFKVKYTEAKGYNQTQLIEFDDKIDTYWEILNAKFNQDPNSELGKKIMELCSRIERFLNNPPKRAIEYGRVYYRREKYAQELSAFRANMNSFGRFKENVLDKMGYSLEEIPQLIQRLDEKMTANSEAKEKLRASLNDRYERIKKEMLADKQNYRTAAQRVEEFSRTNFLLHENFPKRTAAILKGEAAVPIVQIKNEPNEKEKAKVRMRMRIRILKLKKVQLAA